MGMLLHMEIAAAIIIIILLFYHYEIQAGRELKSKWFRFCLFISLATIGSNILSVWGVRYANWIPVWTNMLLSSVYYFLACLNSYVVLLYLLYMIFEHAADKREWNKMWRIMNVLLALEVCLIVGNWFTWTEFRVSIMQNRCRRHSLWIFWLRKTTGVHKQMFQRV